MLINRFTKFARGKFLLLLLLIPIASAIEISVSYLLQTITQVRNHLLSSLFKQKTGLGQDVQKMTNDYYNDFTETVGVLRDDYLNGYLNVFKQICQLVIALALSIMIKPALSLIIILLCLPGIFLPFFQQKKLGKNKQDVLDKSKSYTSKLQDVTNGLRTIQLFNIQRQLQHLFQSQNDKLLLAQNKDQLTRKEIGGISQLFDNLLYLGTWVIGIYFVMNKQISLGQLVAFSQLMIFISEPIQSASGLIGDVLGGREAAKKIDSKISPTKDHLATKKLTDIKTITYKNVTLKDNGQTILHDITLEFQTPKHYLIVGKSGSGKSTLLNLPLSDKYVDGVLSINGHPISDFASSDIFKHIGLLEQQSYIFDDTLANSLSLYSTDYTQAELIEVLKQIVLEKYATADGLQSHVDAHSNILSGGERRRIALGRLLLRQTDFDFFDEPLTGLDPKTSREISQILMNLTNGSIVVTHQYDQALFDKADEIIVLDGGEIQAKGTLDNLNVQNWLRQLNLV